MRDRMSAGAEPVSRPTVAGRAPRPADDPDDAGPTLLYLIGRVDRVVRRAIDELVAAHGLSVNQYTTLSVLSRRTGLSNAQLARRSLVSPQSANEVLLALEQHGLVRRRAHPNHGRILQTRLTAKGRRTLAACDAQTKALEARMVGGLSRRQQAVLRQCLLSCVHALHGGLEGDEGQRP
jgi:DNA-binding MarR family transcriptional regulator